MIPLDIARKILYYVRTCIKAQVKKELPDRTLCVENIFQEHHGIVLQFYRKDNKSIESSIPIPLYPLKETIMRSVQELLFERKWTITEEDLASIEIGIHILSEPVLLHVKRTEDYFDLIHVGFEGISIQAGIKSSLVLPSVAELQKWTTHDLLCYACEQAGLEREEWRDRDIVKICTFKTESFREKEGRVYEIN